AGAAGDLVVLPDAERAGRGPDRPEEIRRGGGVLDWRLRGPGRAADKDSGASQDGPRHGRGADRAGLRGVGKAGQGRTLAAEADADRRPAVNAVPDGMARSSGGQAAHARQRGAGDVSGRAADPLPAAEAATLSQGSGRNSTRPGRATARPSRDSAGDPEKS